jgi:hypothetical protein
MIPERDTPAHDVASASDAETRAVLEQVFDSVWQVLAASQSRRHVHTEQSMKLKGTLINRIADMAAAGETNPKILRARALEAVALSH